MTFKYAWKELSGVIPHDILMRRWLISEGHFVPIRFFKISGLRNYMVLRLIWDAIAELGAVLLLIVFVIASLALIMVGTNECQDPQRDLYNAGLCYFLAGVSIFLVFVMRSLLKLSIEKRGQTEHDIEMIVETRKCADRMRSLLCVHQSAPLELIWLEMRLHIANHEGRNEKCWEMESLRQRFGMEDPPDPECYLPFLPNLADNPDPEPWELEGEGWKDTE